MTYDCFTLPRNTCAKCGKDFDYWTAKGKGRYKASEYCTVCVRFHPELDKDFDTENKMYKAALFVAECCREMHEDDGGGFDEENCKGCPMRFMNECRLYADSPADWNV